jgi:hypothetical protein
MAEIRDNADVTADVKEVSVKMTMVASGLKCLKQAGWP